MVVAVKETTSSKSSYQSAGQSWVTETEPTIETKDMKSTLVTLSMTFGVLWSQTLAYRRSVLFDTFMGDDPDTDPCYDTKLNKPIACIPDFVNAAFGVPVKATSTCGSPPRSFCLPGRGDDCRVCDQDKPHLSHPPEFLTDLHNPNNVTCWQSDIMSLDPESGNVTLTINLKKKYELTYISLHFCHAKPHSMVLLKSMDHGKTWQPFQYYSKNCKAVFGRETNVKITRANEQEPLCIDDHLDEPSNLRIAFSTLANRPSSEDFETSPVLQDWVTATDIRVVFPAVSSVTSKSTKEVKRPKTMWKPLALKSTMRSKKSLNVTLFDDMIQDIIDEEEEYEDDLAEDDYEDEEVSLKLGKWLLGWNYSSLDW